MHTMTVQTVEVQYIPQEIGERLDQPHIAGEFVLKYLGALDSDQEHLGILCLDVQHRLLGVKVLSSGTRTEAPLDSPKLWQTALKLGSTGVVLFHNHPSGDLEPSRNDLSLTRRVVIAGGFVGVSCHDHILTANGPSGSRWISFRSIRPEIFDAPTQQKAEAEL